MGLDGGGCVGSVGVHCGGVKRRQERAKCGGSVELDRKEARQRARKTTLGCVEATLMSVQGFPEAILNVGLRHHSHLLAQRRQSSRHRSLSASISADIDGGSASIDGHGGRSETQRFSSGETRLRAWLQVRRNQMLVPTLAVRSAPGIHLISPGSLGPMPGRVL
eukprot:2797071-Rhodomonas_salina.1